MGISIPEFIHTGRIVKVNGWIGMIADIAFGREHVMLLIDSPKMVARGGRSEWLEYTLNPDAWQPATEDEMRQEFTVYREYIRKRLDALDALEKRIADIQWPV